VKWPHPSRSNNDTRMETKSNSPPSYALIRIDQALQAVDMNLVRYPPLRDVTKQRVMKQALQHLRLESPYIDRLSSIVTLKNSYSISNFRGALDFIFQLLPLISSVRTIGYLYILVLRMAHRDQSIGWCFVDEIGAPLKASHGSRPGPACYGAGI